MQRSGCPIADSHMRYCPSGGSYRADRWRVFSTKNGHVSARGFPLSLSSCFAPPPSSEERNRHRRDHASDVIHVRPRRWRTTSEAEATIDSPVPARPDRSTADTATTGCRAGTRRSAHRRTGNDIIDGGAGADDARTQRSARGTRSLAPPPPFRYAPSRAATHRHVDRRRVRGLPGQALFR